MLRICSLLVSTLLAGIVLAPPTAANILQGSLRVVDGDTFDLDGVRIRLQGVDAPEMRDSCVGADGQNYPCGAWATEALRQLVGTQRLVCHDLHERTYNRVVARCDLGGQDLGALLVERGIARACPRFASRHPHSRGYMTLEAQAIAAGVGLHAGQTPSLAGFCTQDGQRALPVSGSTPPSPDCAIKGNISSNGRIYHMPGQRDYDRTVIRTDRGQRWFCSEAEAQAAGWRRALR